MDCRRICGIDIPWEQWKLLTKDDLKRGELGGWMPQWAFCIFGPQKEADPILLIVGTQGLQKSAYFLVGLFHLAVGLRMIVRGKDDSHMKIFHTWEVNCAPHSLTISSGKPQYRNTWLNMSSAVSKAVGNLGSGIRQKNFDNRSSSRGWSSLGRQGDQSLSLEQGVTMGVVEKVSALQTEFVGPWIVHT